MFITKNGQAMFLFSTLIINGQCLRTSEFYRHKNTPEKKQLQYEKVRIHSSPFNY